MAVKKETLLEKVVQYRLLPVIAIHDSRQADPLAAALIEGGLPLAEVTFRTKDAAKSMSIMAKRNDVIVGAGTVLSIEQVKEALDSGACFMVSPGLNPKVVSYCLENDIPIFPGVVTPSEVMAAMDLGIDVFKFFPAQNYGGVQTLKALSGPFPKAQFIPTGGINAENIGNYLALPQVIACGGSWIANTTDLADGNFAGIVQKTREAVAMIKTFDDR